MTQLDVMKEVEFDWLYGTLKSYNFNLDKSKLQKELSRLGCFVTQKGVVKQKK